MLGRLTRLVIVRPAMLVVMMADAVPMVDFVRDVEHFLERKRTILHGIAMQRKQKHQENTKKAAHGKIVRHVGR